MVDVVAIFDVGVLHCGVLGCGDEQRVTGGVQYGVLGVAHVEVNAVQVDVALYGEAFVQDKLAVLHAQGHKNIAEVHLQHSVAVGGAGQRGHRKITVAALDAQLDMIHLLPRRVDEVGAGLVQRVKVNAERQAVVHGQAADHLSGVFGAVERFQRAELGGGAKHVAVADFAVGGQSGEVVIADGRGFVQPGLAVGNGVPPGKALAVAQRENLPGNVAVIGVGILHFVGEIGRVIIDDSGAVQIGGHLGVGAYRDGRIQHHVPQGHAENIAAHADFGHHAEVGRGALHLPVVIIHLYSLGGGVYFVARFRRYSVKSRVRCPPRTVVVLVVALVRVKGKAGVQVAVVQVPVGVGGVEVALAAHREAAQGGGVACQVGEGDVQRAAPAQQHPQGTGGEDGRR